MKDLEALSPADSTASSLATWIGLWGFDLGDQERDRALLQRLMYVDSTELVVTVL